MSRPTLITVQGTYLKLDGTPEEGTVYFRSKVFSLSSEDATVMVPSVIKATLGPDGAVAIQVPATNDPEWSPSTWTYEVHLRLSESVYTFSALVPYDVEDGILELSHLLPVGPSGGNLYAPYNHTHAGGGSGVDPATAVVAETSFGQASVVGVGTKYARNDHSHGTPATPTAAGIGAAAAVHAHAAADITSGVLGISRIPTGTSGTTVALGNDSRLSDSRTPTAHAASHASAGSDPITISQTQVTDLTNDLASMTTAVSLKAPLASPTFTGTVSGVTKTHVGLGNVDNTSDATKNSASATLSNKTLASPTFTGTPTGLTKAHVGLGSVDNTADTAKPVSTAQQAALDAKVDVLVLASGDPVPGGTRTGTVIVRLA